MSASSLKKSLAILLLASSAAAWAGQKGFLGMGVSADGEGFFLNPILKTVTVNEVTPKSPAAAAGITVGDQIIEIEGHKVAGAKANDLEPYLNLEVGQALKLVLRKVSGETQAISLVAAQSPK